MTIREFGQQKERMLLFFPESCEPWQEFAYAAKELAARFHVLLVTPDGHDPEEHTDFISVEKTVDDTVRWLKEHGIDRLEALYGLSFGGAMESAFPPERFARDPAHAKEEYEYMRKCLKTFSSKTIWNIFWSANNYSVPKRAPAISSKIQFWVGDEEWSDRYRDLKWYREYLSQMEVVTIPHSMHGEYVMMRPKEFAAQALSFFES